MGGKDHGEGSTGARSTGGRKGPPRRAPAALSLALASALLTLAGCGGGSDPVPPALQVPAQPREVAASSGADLQAEALEAQAGALARAVVAAAGNPLGLDSLPTAGGAAPALAVPALLQMAFGAPGGRDGPLAIHLMSRNCPAGGHLTLQMDDADENLQPSAGDTLWLIASACVLQVGALPLDGLVTVVLQQLEYDAEGALRGLGAVGMVSGLSLGPVGSLQGPYRLRLKVDTAWLQRQRFEYQAVLLRREGSEALTLDLDVYTETTPTQVRHALSGGLGLGGQTYRVVPDSAVPLTHAVQDGLAEAWPSSGRLRLVDAQGDAVVLSARPGARVDAEFLGAGQTAPAAALLDQPWSRLLLPVP